MMIGGFFISGGATYDIQWWITRYWMAQKMVSVAQSVDNIHLVKNNFLTGVLFNYSPKSFDFRCNLIRGK
ncbi:hypothetical protein CHH90_14475 [Bacillus licheniformis]|jgi:ABC-type lipoprotein release transport system permease subunit|nr:hypothetical protein MUY_000549 [Bacillus licheniformis WX-02]AMR09174.1 hypothetical protein AB684_02870 [Bacillus licheniformis]ASV14164.1 hypothetical protein CJO35_02925 [Bacillus sp. 1s-1]KUL06607.1 hypothetical protein LI17339_20960 [Bacillus licheniformis LMG 17339]AWV39435.1 hypothetical protein CD200_02930 [Bacillus licheniformis]